MATLDDVLTTQKNGVIAINNLNQSLLSFYEYYKFVNGIGTSATVSESASLVVGPGRLINYTTVASGGSTAGMLYDDVSYNIISISGTGTSATLTYSGSDAFQIGDTIYVSGCSPAGYNTASATVVGVTAHTVTYVNATTGALTVNGIAMNIKPARRLTSVSGTLGTYPIGVKFYRGLTVIPASGQSVNVSYFSE